MSSPFANFECDKCGACCESLIIEAHEYDARREPRLYDIRPVDRQALRDGEGAIILYDFDRKCCPFLSDAKECTIYPTRPVDCVMVEAGDAKCQQARMMRELPLLRDKDGALPSRELLESSCGDYGLEYEDLFS